jgi:hypothetical protein
LDTGPVLLLGEFRNPGSYELRRGERLSEVIARAGGLTPEAFPYGAVFTRESVRQRQQEGFARTARDLESSLVQLAAGQALPGARGGTADVGGAMKAGRELAATLREARAAGADDALVCNTNGELCCATAANLVLQRGGLWFTPPTGSGCLPGVMRGRALALGLVQEAPLAPELLEDADAALLLNSLDCRPLRLPGPAGREPAVAEAKGLWHRCAGLDPDPSPTS